MRDIKYKGWNTEQNIMYSAKELGQDELTIDPDDRGFVNVCSSDKKFSEYYSHILPLQYTSLKDKNGVEIYEGDIVEYRGKSGVVFMRLGCWFVEHQRELGYYNNTVEIIGNKYKNPELLI